MESFLGSGDLYLDRLDADGTRNGLFLAGNATLFSLQANAEIKEQTSKGRSDYGQVLASATRAQPPKLAINLNQLDQKNLAMAFLGTTSDIEVDAGSVEGEEIAAVTLDNWYRLAQRNIDEESVVVEYESGSIGPVAAVAADFEVIARTGMIRALSTGSIPEGATLIVDYDYLASTGAEISGAVQPTIKGYLFLDGKNETNGHDCEVEVWEAQLRPTSPVDFLSDDFSTLSLEGTPVTPTGQTAPFRVRQYD